jgi:hypothetical protein
MFVPKYCSFIRNNSRSHEYDIKLSKEKGSIKMGKGHYYKNQNVENHPKPNRTSKNL